MRNIYFIFVVGVMLSLTSCIPENLVNLKDVEEVESVTVIAPSPIQFEPITGSAMTKGTSVEDGNTLLFSWAVGDTLGIFPNKGNQVEFPITAVQGSTSATFDGGGWALRNNASYAAYYPFSVWNYHRDNETILLDYSGQVQDGNGSFAHLSAYDFLASNKATPQNSAVAFQMERQGSILYIDIVVPEPETISALTISCDEAIFVEKAALDISGNTPAITPVEMSKTLTLFFRNTVTTANNETVRAYMAVQPVDFSDKTVTATLVTASGRYSATVTPRTVNRGRAAFLRFSDDFTPVNIQFADAEVKRICVENWDTDGDGELSYKEAAAVNDLGNVFEYKSITSFNELIYFKGLTSIKSWAFCYCTNLKSIVIPSNITVISTDAFSRCSALTSVVINEGVSSIGLAAFWGCTNLTSIVIPESMTTIAREAFGGCSHLNCFQGKFASVDGRCLIVDGVLKAFAPYGLSSYTIPEGVTGIEENTFEHISTLSSLTIPESVTAIGELAFYKCSGLNEFKGKFASTDSRCIIVGGEVLAFAPYGLSVYTIPSEATKIGRDAFAYCTNLLSVVIPGSVSTINYNAFQGCTALGSVVIPESVEYINDSAFRECSGLNQIECKRSTPPNASNNIFYDTNNCPIYVPNESVEAYKAAEGWSAYADRIIGFN